MSDIMDNSRESVDDICNDHEIIDSFISEAKEHLDTIEDDFLNLEEQKDDPDQELLDKVFRAVHSVKGAAGFLGLDNMTRLAHVMETILTRMREGTMRPESEYIDALLAGLEHPEARVGNSSSRRTDSSEIRCTSGSAMDASARLSSRSVAARIFSAATADSE